MVLWVWGASSRKRRMQWEGRPRCWLPGGTAESRRSGLGFGIRVTRKRSCCKGSFSNAFLLGSVEHPDTVQVWTRAKDLSRNSKPCTKTTLDLEQMKGTLREFKERAYIPRWLLAGYFERRLGPAFLPASPRGLFQHSFSLLVYSRARGLGSLNMEIPAALGTALSQLGLLRSLFWWC